MEAELDVDVGLVEMRLGGALSECQTWLKHASRGACL